MKNILQQNLIHFLKRYDLKDRHLLVAVSGGVDSMVLLDLLKDMTFLKLSCVHVDHGWREESKEEYKFLEDFCLKQNIPFYGTHFDINHQVKDLENESRKKRYAFFQSVYKQSKADGLFLGHQQNDLEETVTKRLFEGAHLCHLGGMREQSYFEEMTIYRPLLGVLKTDLYEYAATKLVPFFEDRTNQDSRFQRNRIRSELFFDVFGKKVQGSLSKLSQEAFMLRDYMLEKFEKQTTVYSLNSQVAVVELKEDLHQFEIYNFLILFFKKIKLTVSKAILVDLATTLLKGGEPKKFFQNKHMIHARTKVCMVLSEQTELDFRKMLPYNEEQTDKIPEWVRAVYSSRFCEK